MNRGRRKWIVFAAAAGAVIVACLAEGLDVNAYLSCAYRSEIIGPEMWTQCIGGGVGDWMSPTPGLDGDFYLTHDTSIRQAIAWELVDGSTPLEISSVRNHWTPAWRETWYRAKALDRPDECPEIGDTVIREKKCITCDNVFIAEVTVKNTGRAVRNYTFAIVPHDKLATEGEWKFKTVSMNRQTGRRTYVKLNSSFGGTKTSFTLQPHEEKALRYAFAVAPESAARASEKAASALSEADPWGTNAAAFNAWMHRNAPDLILRGDPDTERLYWYRWFVVWRGIHNARRAVAEHEYPRQTIYESPSGVWYGCVIGLPVPMQVREAAWMRDGSVVRDHLLNWAEGVKGYRGYIQFTARAAVQYLQLHPDRELVARILPELEKDALMRAGDDASVLPKTHGSWMTGAEYQPNFYQYTDPPWDYRHDTQLFRKVGGDRNRDIAWLTRLDTVAYVAGDILACAELERMLGERTRADELRKRAEAMLSIVRTRHWDERLGLFLAADPKTGRLCDQASCYDSFAPYMWGLISEAKYDRAFDKLCDRNWFWDDFAVTTVAKTCPMYSGVNGITGPYLATPAKMHHYSCCWNGPIWHYADSLVAEAFGCVARRDKARREKWLAFFRSWSDSHFTGGDRTSMRAGEHFRPEDGVQHRGTYDYFHSAWIDPFIRYYCGITPHDLGKGPKFEPFYRGDFKIGPIVLRGREFVFEQKDGKRVVRQ